MRWMQRGDAALFERERAWLVARLADGHAVVERRGSGDGAACFAKASALRGRAAARHAARRAIGIALPRLREFENLAWLRANGFSAPRPLLAGAVWSGATPRFQFLYTEAVDDAPTLEALVQAEDERARDAVLALARLTAKLHARGFVHRDLFLRNVLVPRASEGRAPGDLVLLDAWRGGVRSGLRSADYDVGCLAHDLARHGREAWIASVLDVYVDAGAATSREQLNRAIARVRRARSARDARAEAKRARRDSGRA